MTLKIAKKVYGFSLAYASDFNQIVTANDSGFAYNNIMVGIRDPSAAPDPNLFPKCGYYEVDEPLKMNYSPTATINFDNKIASWNTGAKLLLTDYNWPAAEPCDGGKSAGLWLTMYMSNNNTYIMCDAYNGGLCGSECDFWDEYSHYYNPIPFSNWLMNEMVQTSNWDCAFKLANGSDQNINQIWLYACNDGDITSVQTFCGYAWQNGWLLRQEKQIEFEWKCDSPDPCTNCVWPYGTWYLYDSYYTGQEQYVGY